MTSFVNVHRHNGGAPILAPTGNDWESGVTFNAAAVALSQSPSDRLVIQRLLSAAGRDSAKERNLVAALYRARPRTDPGYPMTRSRIGLALFSPEFELIQRFDDPVLVPDHDRRAADYLGVEDPRITRIGDRFVMVYCGCGLEEPSDWRMAGDRDGVT